MIKIILIITICGVIFSSELITPIPQKISFDKERAELGEKLFFDTRLSSDNSISCATCHDIFSGGDDGQKNSFGVEGAKGEINAPTVLNATFNFVQFWDGRVNSLEEQASGPIHNPIEMKSNFSEVLEKLSQDKEYVERFNKVYIDGMSGENIVNAIAEFERTLITPNGRFDKFLFGDNSAITESEKYGFELFKSYGCISCHNGVNIGGNLYQKIGVVKKYYSDKNINFGRYNITKNENDKFYFKVPTLRNIVQTGPYFHDGSVTSLVEAVKIMFEYQLGIEPKDDDVKKIIEFLGSLNGKLRVDG